MRKFKVYIIAVLLHSTAFGQNAKFSTISKEEAIGIMKQVAIWYASTPSYSFAVTHAIYSDAAAKAPLEESNGYYRKFSKGSHGLTVGVHNIMASGLKVSLDTVRRIMLVSNLPKDEGTGFSAEEYQQALSRCNTVKYALVGEEKHLLLAYGKGAAISLYELVIDKSGRLNSVMLQYANEVKSEKGGMMKPRVFIRFDKYSTGVNSKKDELDLTRYFKREGSILKLASAYRDYTLLDQRITDEKP